jgi:hypothetical protein
VITLHVQTLTALLQLTFALLAARIWIRSAERSGTAAPWGLAALFFGIGAASSILHSGWAIAAVRVGAGHTLYESYLEWMPGLNYGRSLTGIGFALCLPLVGFANGPRRRHALALFLGVAALALAGGQLMGAVEGALDMRVHPTRIALLHVVELIALLGALLVSIQLRTLDSWLLLAITVYAFRQGINAVLGVGFSWIGLAEVWHPPFWLVHMIGAVGWSLMIILAALRLRRTRSARVVAAAFESEPSGRVNLGLRR